VDNSSKLDGRAREGRWLGFDQETIDGHRIYFPDTHAIRVECSVKFPPMQRSGEIFRVLNEGETEIEAEKNGQKIQHTPSTMPQIPKPSPCAHITTDSPLTTPPTTPLSGPQSPKATAPRDISSAIDVKNIIKGTQTHHSAHVAHTENSDNSQLHMEFAYVGMGTLSDSPTVEEAMTQPDWPQFKAAMDVEMKAMKRTSTFGDSLVPRPIGRNVVRLKWALRIKHKTNGEIDKYKARLVARGFTKVQGVNRQVVQKPHKPHAASCSFLALCKAAGRISSS
jgi:hypothetical protein